MARSGVRVRPAEPVDVSALAEVVNASDAATGAFNGKSLTDPSVEHLRERFSQIIADGERVLLVAVDDTDTVIGLLAARHDDIGAIDLTPVLHVTHLLVVPCSRRRGVGRALLAGAVQLAEDSGVERVLTTAAAGSREGNRYLARIGFAPLVVNRIATTATLRRSLGMADASGRLAALRRTRVLRAQRAGFARPSRPATRGA